MTIIYGDNGSGKSTLAAALDSLRSADADLIIGRRALGATAGPRLSISSTDGPLVLDGSSWNAAMFRLEVFHQGFIDRNVFTGHLVTNAHKQNLCEFVLGG